jgi:hypothetical protein
MKCRLVVGSDFVDLAGASGPSSDTQGLNIGYNVEAEKVNYIGVDEARQYFRPGSQITASFTSTTEYATVAEAEAAMGALYETLKDQTGGVAYLGGITYDGTNQVETATASGTVQTRVTISQGTADAIHYTTDGTNPTTSSPTISSGGSFLQSGSFRVKALAVKSGLTDSAIISRGFVTVGQVNEATVSPESSGQPAGSVTVTVTNALAGVTMHYTTNGTDPTTSSPTVANGGTVSVPVPGQLRVLSVKAGLANSPIKEANYVSLPTATGYTTGTYVDGATTYRWHQITQDARVRFSAAGVALDYLVVGGGGAGGGASGGRNGGGGGSGQIRTGSSTSTASDLLAIIGKGGVTSITSPATSAADGGLTSFIVGAGGGGGGGVGANQNGRDGTGGSGGGATATGTGGAGVFVGGAGVVAAGFRSGGGGSSAANGQTQSGATTDLTGVAGTSSSITGSAVTYANGGGVLGTIPGTALTPGSGGNGRRGADGSAGQNGADGVVIFRHVEGAVTVTVFNEVTATPAITPSSTAAASSNVLVTVTTSAGSQVFTIPTLAGETAATWAATTRAQLAASAFITRNYTVSGTGASIILTSKKHQSDPSLNISIANGSPSAGINPAATSTGTAPGSPDTVTPVVTIFDAIAQVNVGYRGKSLSIQSNISGRTTAP